MRYVSAYLLARLGGNENPKEVDIKKILSSVGIDSDDALVKKVVSELSGKNIEELIAAGREKLASVPSGGAVVATTASTTAAAPDSKAAEPAKAKEEEKKEESDEDDGDMGFGLFD
ncbi:hypothetical protein HELRODRAFT_98115 [Helobdella robusta]|uniref:Large ribosomal subunit protein P2 n=1 Tax=Helobdella robusta TaxID=6412 RepID=T1G9K8_HELRO|nr:hypothetical protein HELRODRAFT_98115 [Helobdella robusta]ESO07940.1 hypothetical protein HELRODRAFT_98115 [Helobdella robusta]